MRPPTPVPTAEEVDALNAAAWRWRHEDTRRALGMTRRALTLARAGGHRRGEAYALLRMALCEYILGQRAADFDARLDHTALLMGELGDRAGEAEALNLMANIRSTRGQAQAAVDLHRRCLRLREANADLAGQAGSLANLALAWRQLGRLDDALACARRSLDLARRLGEARAIAYAQVNLGQIALDQDAAATAAECFDMAYTHATRTDDRALECTALTGLALARVRQGSHDVAQQLLAHAQQLAQRVGNAGDLVRVQLALARLAQAQGQALAAEAHLLGVLPAIRREAHHEVEAQALLCLAEVQWTLGRAEAARTRLAEAENSAQAYGPAALAAAAAVLRARIGPAR